MHDIKLIKMASSLHPVRQLRCCGCRQLGFCPVNETNVNLLYLTAVPTPVPGARKNSPPRVHTAVL
ncbi:hypothetical protein CLF_112659, partial [Clonorchis sinensis]